ncbi:MAG: glucokinase [Spirochaetes bacterium]|nr:glucokinase [Spirochaetota bacterium]
MPRKYSKEYILAGDIGGTNTTFAVVGHIDGKFEILHSRRFSTQAERSVLDPISTFLAELGLKGFHGTLSSCCISAAGPVENGSIQLTNAPWSISASEIEEVFGISTRLVNDFTAISYAVVLLDPDDPAQIRRIPHIDGSNPDVGKGMALVVGAGTGLGVGFVDKKDDGSYLAYPSEGGHSEVPCHDPLTLDLFAWLGERTGYEPGAELLVSGQGISNIFSFLCSEAFDPGLARSYGIRISAFSPFPSVAALEILSKPEADRPALIASKHSIEPRCGLAMELFVDLYARKVSNLSAVFLPKGGVYLAGGISSKNEAFLLEGNRFMKCFERNYAPHIRTFLKEVPVLIVRDYTISLIGAANAAVQLSKEKAFS